jgi:uncharacterized protein YjbI with pentapeptide repeats
MRKIREKNLKKILKKHHLWAENKNHGERAILSDADLSGADLWQVDLRYAGLNGANLSNAVLRGARLWNADLRGADLWGADLWGADFRGAYLRGAVLYSALLYEAKLRNAYLQGADLRYANLEGADLRKSKLRGADLRGAYLSGANLAGANLEGAELSEATLPDFQICPEDKMFIGWKKVAGDVILKLEILGQSTSSLVGRKCRASKVMPTEAYNMNGEPVAETEFTSIYNENFKYVIGKVSEATNYDDDIRIECASGIHFFITREEAEKF